MKRLLIPGLALAASVVPLARQQDPTYRAGTHTVSIYATVVDAGGRLVPDLARGDFEVLDNGVPQALSLFTNDIQPITIVIMLDRSGSMASNFNREREAAERFVSELLPADRARVGSFSNAVQIDPASFTSDRDELIRVLHEDLQDIGPTPLWNATSAAMNALASQRGRRVVLVFTDGIDSPNKPGPNVTLDQIISRMHVEETMVYAIGLSDPCGWSPAPLASPVPEIFGQRRGGAPGRIGGRIPPRGGGLPPKPFPLPPARPPAFPPTRNSGSDSRGPCASLRPDPGLRELADEGGGSYFELLGTDDLAATFARVANELHHQYLLAFPAPTLDGKLHKLEVRVRPSGLTVRARKSYLAEPR